MTDVHRVLSPADHPGPSVPRTGWGSWVYFTAVMLVMLGAFEAISGLVALFNDSYFVVPARGLVLSVSYTAWGWTHVIVGLIAVVAGLGVMAAKTWARVIAVTFAVLSALANIASLQAYPLWSALIIGIDVLVIFGLTVHGREAGI
jgi:hypothetical protein